MTHPSNELSLVPIAVRETVSGAATAGPSSSASSPHARPLGPGWFDSSFELQRGLVIKEGWSDEDRLRVWVEAFLGDQREAAGGESSSAT